MPQASHLNSAHLPVTLVDLLVILATAAVVTLAFRRLRLATIPAFLVAGALIGPSALGFVASIDRIQAIGQLATILLMFMIGLNLDLRQVRTGMVSILLIGLASTIGTTLVVLLCAAAVRMPLPAGLTIAMAVAMSSTAAVLRLLLQRRELHQNHGRICLGVLIVQDLLVVVALAALPLLAATSPDTHAAAETWTGRVLALASDAATSVGAFGLLILLGRLVLPRLMHLAASAGAEILLLIAAAVGLGAALLTGYLGFSAELGAFLAGFLLAPTPFRHQLSGQLVPMRDLFMAVFFVSVGLTIDVPLVGRLWWVVLVASVGLTLTKTLTIGLAAWCLGAPPRVSVRAGLALAQAGEFTLVILGAGRRLGTVDDLAADAIIAVVAVTLFLTPSLIGLGTFLAHRMEHWPTAPWLRRTALSAPDPHTEATTGHIIVAGFGPVGRSVTDRLTQLGLPCTIIELNPATVRRQAALGRHVVYGDASNPDVLMSAGVERARAAILTIPDDHAMFRAVRAIRELNPGLFIAARAHVLSRALQARQLGADYVVVDETATAEAMAREVAAALAAPAPPAD